MSTSVWYCPACGFGPLNPNTDAACPRCDWFPGRPRRHQDFAFMTSSNSQLCFDSSIQSNTDAGCRVQRSPRSRQVQASRQPRRDSKWRRLGSRPRDLGIVQSLSQFAYAARDDCR
ncbi:hypothetical protein EX30DRAFT_350783 [Ascodesmis nigricans]|uniref:Uncharacterized protein n=1 Tax=Ascodesmis nigricans TaxID=341454 RepID=A0A4S2MNJ2_9PEZI|nr:hypothetical protein EX30DRAFT_350783 [Ascodesmis nigricans]